MAATTAAYVRFLRGTPAAFKKVTDKDPDTLYFISETGADYGDLYLGHKLIAGKSSLTSMSLGDLTNVIIGSVVDNGSLLVYDVELGKWKHESTFSKARFVRQKCYLEMIDDEVKITCAGMPKSCYKFVEWEKFKQGFTCGGKLTFKHVIGGVKLVETDFTIKYDKKLKQSIKML